MDQVREAILRSPQEIQKQAESALKRVGMLVPVCGAIAHLRSLARTV